MNEVVKRLLIGAAILLLSLLPLGTNLGQDQSKLIKPCMAESTPKKTENTANTNGRKGRKRQKTKDGKKDRSDQHEKNSNCN